MKFYITTPIYYVNDKPHIGHAYTTIAADVLARYHRLAGDEVYFLTGTDEHGAKVADSAAAAGKTPKEFCDENAAKYQVLWDRLDISNDQFIRTTDELHLKGVEKFLSRLKETGAIYVGEYEGLYCRGCERFLTEKELVNGKCPDHLTLPELISEKNYFFKLKEYLPKVAELIDREEIMILPATRKSEVLGLIKQGLNDFSVSRESVKWGIELPFDRSQVAYVWVDALINYISALGYGADDSKFQKFWPAEIHLMAKDIIKFHALYWPAMLVAAGLPAPKTVFAHGFFTVDSQKMSKSLGNVIDPDALIDSFGAEAVRYLLLSQFPFGQDGDVKAASFVTQYNSDLANGIGNFASRVTTMVEKYFGGRVPARSSELKGEVEKFWQGYRSALADFQVDGALAAIKNLNNLGDGYVEANKPWELAKTDQTRLSEVIYNLLEILRHLALMLWPVMPAIAEKIFTALGQGDFSARKIAELQIWGLLEPESKVSKTETLFPRIQ